MNVPGNVTVVDHVLLRRLVSILRDRDTPHGVFRQTLDDAGMILAYEAMRSLRPEDHELETPLERTSGVRLRGGGGRVARARRARAGRRRRAPRRARAPGGGRPAGQAEGVAGGEPF